MTLTFEHTTLGQRVLFGSGRAAEYLQSEVARLGAQRVMVLASPAEAHVATAVTTGISVSLSYDNVVQHVPVDVAEHAVTEATVHAIDLVVCIGGGSTTGLAKAIALRTGIPIIAVPTTYAGSEATNVWGLTQGARKTTGVDDRVLPVSVIYDASLTLTLPRDLSVASGFNAIAHCIDSLWGPRADPINRTLAAEGIRALDSGLRQIDADEGDLSGREQCLYGAYLSAVAFASAGSGLHHKICHVLGGTYNLPHAQTHAVVLPHVLAFNSTHAPEAERRIAAAFGSTTAVSGLDELRRQLGAPFALGEYGFREADVEEAARLILPVVPATNPRSITVDDLERLLRAAWAGTPAMSEE